MSRHAFKPKNKTAAAPRVAAGAELDAEWRRWIAENLLLGISDDILVERLRAKGCPPLIVRREIALARDNPYFRGAAVLQQRLKKRDWVLESRARLEAMAPGGKAVARVHAMLADDFLRDHYAAHRPVVLSGLVDHWPARGWTLDRFGTMPGDTDIEVQWGREENGSYEIESTQLKRRMPLAELVALLREDRTTNNFYVTANNSGVNRDALAPLYDELGTIDGYLAPGAERQGFFWMGPRGTITPWHHDLTNNLLLQLSGRKRVMLAPSAETPRMRNHLHCFSAFGGDAACSDAPEGERPRLLSCDIGPGDVLFIPVGWWHHVEALDLTIGVSFTGFVWDNDFYSNYTTQHQV